MRSHKLTALIQRNSELASHLSQFASEDFLAATLPASGNYGAESDHFTNYLSRYRGHFHSSYPLLSQAPPKHCNSLANSYLSRINGSCTMDYPYENLSPERFQLFCQSLLQNQFSHLQSFPVGQPDGGRDALHYIPEHGGNGAIVFQVKFVRNPQGEKDPHKWLQDIVDNEAPKIANLLRNHVKEYIILTNIKGTGHLDTGSIDKIQSILQKHIPVTAQCWWRDDLNSRLDNAWNLKWMYPELLTGPDFLRILAQTGMSDSIERRTSAITAFLAHQHGTEQQVKFKQVELQNSLLDLFIDIPISQSHFYTQWQFPHSGPIAIDPFATVDSGWDASASIDVDYYQQRKSHTGAAHFLLSNLTNSNFVVLEGAPGQGKSTITQYICQVYRMRLLSKQTELKRVNPLHQSGGVRLPIKVDLRDFATWIERKNPFTAEADALSGARWSKTLEAFLAFLIGHFSGGTQFDVSDLHAIFRISSVIIALDGLDEVADINRRKEIVSEIEAAASRLSANCASLRVLVTSRPAAFANSPGLSTKLFQYFSLESVTPELIDEYGTKWIKARRLQDREGHEVKNILKEKLEQPHIRDLARNPMQLAILLSLIHTRGRSLPDKRTALYDTYIDLFFNRESEKSPIVRKHRDLLIDIHRYLAWLLHTEAESSNGARVERRGGAITADRLSATLRVYLETEGHNPALADELFTGVVERVVALVSRVEGTYEFEVQPLREYFAARFLFETAPYSPPGNERRGTRPDRFDAISRNFYWLNVTRFFAGCYSKGELPSLIDRLRELINDEAYRRLSHPRVLASTLLGDYVFAQHPKSVAEVVGIVMDEIGLRFVLSSSSRRLPRTQPLVLAQDCGRKELMLRCLALLKRIPPLDLALDIIDVMNANSSAEEMLGAWLTELTKAKKENLDAWCRYGYQLGCFGVISKESLEALDFLSAASSDVLAVLFKARRTDVIEGSDILRERCIDAILDRYVVPVANLKSESFLDSLSRVLDPYRYSRAFAEIGGFALSKLWGRRRQSSPRANVGPLGAGYKGSDPRFKRIFDVALSEADKSTTVWARSLAPWDNLVETIRTDIGECWAATVLAVTAAGVRSTSETCTDSNQLFNRSLSLCRRARYARLRAGSTQWWLQQLSEVKDHTEAIFALLLLFTWASAPTISVVSMTANEIINKLPTAEWQKLFDGVELVLEISSTRHGERQVNFNTAEPLVNASVRFWALVLLRCDVNTAIHIYRNKFRGINFDDQRCLKAGSRVAIRSIMMDVTKKEDIAIIKQAFEADVLSEAYLAGDLARYAGQRSLSLDDAQKIAESADRYPTFLLSFAEAVCKTAVAETVQPVAGVAAQEGWF